MEGISSLIDQARSAGLVLEADGSGLIVEGPVDAEALALGLLDRKAEVLAHLRGGSKHSEPCLIGCGAELEFTDGLSYCLNCQTHQRIVKVITFQKK